MKRTSLPLHRREFITLLGGAAAAWPLAARAQQPAMPVIGFINAASPEAAAYRVTSFREGLREAGYVDGQNVAIEYRWAEGRYDLMPELVADLLRRGAAVIATPGSTAAALAAKAATTTIPIVFAVGEDPVKLGLVASFSRPGGNATGINFFTVELAAKRLGLLRDMVPGTDRVAILVNPRNAANAEANLREVRAAGQDIGLQIQVLNASTRSEINASFATLVREHATALLVSGDGFFNSRRVQLVMLAARNGIPAIYAVRDYPEAGGLMSYGTSFPDIHRQVGVYVGRILKGVKPAELPVLQPTKLELVINTQAASLIGLNVPANAARPRRRGDRMSTRRDFITLLGGAAAWPSAARAQQAMPVIGFLNSSSPDTAGDRVRAYHNGLRETGYIEGRNVTIEYRWADGQNERLPSLAADLVKRDVSLIVTGGTPATLAAKAATTKIPIVFILSTDPVEAGLVGSLNRPGNNLTGVTGLNVELAPKKLELLRELVPTTTTMALLINPTNRVAAERESRDLEAAARSFGLQLHVLNASTEREFHSIFASLLPLRADALIIGSDLFFTSRSKQLAALTVRYAVPSIYQFREFVAAGGLLSYGGSIVDWGYLPRSSPAPTR